MRVREQRHSGPKPGDPLPPVLPEIALNHGRALWVMQELGFQGGASESTFYEYIKSLRKFGIPFRHGEVGLARRGAANYSYDHLMELALVLTLRVYHVVPDAILAEVIRFRDPLRRLYRRAYALRRRGIGAPTQITSSDGQAMEMRGAFLDLHMNFAGGRLVRFGPSRLISPAVALKTFAQRDLAARAFLPINLTNLSEKIVAFALAAPPLRRGPRPAR